MIRYSSDVGHRFFFLTKLSLYALRGSSTIFSCMQNINSDFFKLYITKKRFFSFRPLSLVNKILQLHQINVGFLWSQQDERQKFLFIKKQIKQDANNQNKNKNKMPFFFMINQKFITSKKLRRRVLCDLIFDAVANLQCKRLHFY